MAIADVDVLILALFVFVFVFLFALGRKVSALFMLIAGISAIFLAVEVQRITDSLVLSIFISAIGVMVIVFGIVGELEPGAYT